MMTLDDVREIALGLPRTTEGVVRDGIRFRVGRVVYVGFSHDETIMGFAFPKDEREALVEGEPEKFLMPRRSELRYHWVAVRLHAVERTELTELVTDAWRMVVPASVAAAHLGD